MFNCPDCDGNKLVKIVPNADLYIDIKINSYTDGSHDLEEMDIAYEHGSSVIWECKECYKGEIDD